MARAKSASTDSAAKLGFEAKLRLSADKLRNNMDAAVTEHSDKRRQQPEPYKHVVLGLIVLKYISDTFDEHHAKPKEGKGDFKGANPEDKDEYLAANVFWVPVDARPPRRPRPRHRRPLPRASGRLATRSHSQRVDRWETRRHRHQLPARRSTQ